MILASGLRASQRAFALLAVSLLSACGGGVGEVVAIVSIVTPLGGAWNVDGNESLIFTGPSFSEVFASKLDVTGRVTSGTGVCGDTTSSGVDVEGTLDNGDLVLHRVGASANCLTGHFTDLVTLEATPTGLPKRVYKNGAVFVQMQLGVWTSVESGVTLKFVKPSMLLNDTSDTANVAGCDVSGSPTKKFGGDMTGFNTITNANPTIAELRSGTEVLFTQVVFVDGDTLTLVNSAGKSVELQRKPEMMMTPCP